MTTLSFSQTWMDGPGNILLAVRMPLSTPSANTHWQCDHTTFVAFGVHTWHALKNTFENTVTTFSQWHKGKKTFSVKLVTPLFPRQFLLIMNTKICTTTVVTYQLREAQRNSVYLRQSSALKQSGWNKAESMCNCKTVGLPMFPTARPRSVSHFCFQIIWIMILHFCYYVTLC